MGEGLKTLVPRLIGQTAEAQKKRIISNKLDESIFFENLDDNGIEFYRELMKFAGENQLKIIWGTKGFSLNVVLEGTNISILRGYCKLSAYDQKHLSPSAVY